MENCKGVVGSNPTRSTTVVNADVAQLIRAMDFHSVGREFESRHLLQDIAQIRV